MHPVAGGLGETGTSVKKRPLRIPGRWKKGFALDYHTVRSIYVGDDEYGHPMFETERTELGDLLYRLKYRSEASVAEEIVRAAAEFLSSWNPGVDAIVPVPPSRSHRSLQPVLVLAEALGKRLELPVTADCVEKVKAFPELKNVYDYDERLRLLDGAYRIKAPSIKGRRVLLFDDLYRSGATMNAVAGALYDQGGAAEVYALTITRTRTKS